MFSGPLVYAVFRGNAYGVGAMRAAFNIAMFIFSPFAGSLAERVSIRSILSRSTFLRMLIYVLFMPCKYRSYCSDHHRHAIVLSALVGS